jgi:hypothetical protein
MEMVNLAGRVWRTGGTPQALPVFTLSGFFHTGDDALSDPRLLYDTGSGRWLASIFDATRATILVAASRSADPTGGWSIQSIPADGCPDQPRLGVADAVVVVAADMFGTCDESAGYEGSAVWVLNKADLLAGAAPDLQKFGPDQRYSTLTPVQSLGTTSTEYLVSVDNPRSTVVHLLAVSGTPPARTTLTRLASIAVSPLSAPPSARTPASEFDTIETNDDRVLDAVWENGTVWLSANDGCTPPGDRSRHACARVIGLDTNVQTLVADSELSDARADLFYPAVRPDAAGNLIVVYGHSSATVMPELLALARTADGGFTQPVVLARADAPQSGSRYGDYFGAARDPSDPSVVWVAGEVGARGAFSGWSTAVAAVSLAVGAPQMSVRDMVAPTVRAIASAGRRGSPVRLEYRLGDDSGSSRALVTVSRGGRTVFTAATLLVPVDPARIAYVLWRPDAALRRGTFRFCVRATDAAGNRSPASCSSVTLR